MWWPTKLPTSALITERVTFTYYSSSLVICRNISSSSETHRKCSIIYTTVAHVLVNLDSKERSGCLCSVVLPSFVFIKIFFDFIIFFRQNRSPEYIMVTIIINVFLKRLNEKIRIMRVDVTSIISICRPFT